MSREILQQAQDEIVVLKIELTCTTKSLLAPLACLIGRKKTAKEG
jgi:hypothetical protein